MCISVRVRVNNNNHQVPSADSNLLGRVSESSNSPLAGVPITGCIGDQQSAMVGQKCFGVGDAKTTYGTGAFTLINTGDKPCASNHGLLTTVLYQMGSEKSVQYVLFVHFHFRGSLSSSNVNTTQIRFGRLRRIMCCRIELVL